MLAQWREMDAAELDAEQQRHADDGQCVYFTHDEGDVYVWCPDPAEIGDRFCAEHRALIGDDES